MAKLPVPQHPELAPGTLRALVRAAGLSVDDLAALLKPETLRQAETGSRLAWSSTVDGSFGVADLEGPPDALAGLVHQGQGPPLAASTRRGGVRRRGQPLRL